MNSSGVQPIRAGQRIALLDILRGWALFGVVLMNYYDHYFTGMDFTRYHPGTVTVILQYICAYVFSAKAWTMLSVLFGYGFAVLMDNLRAKGRHPVLFFAGRMWWLLVLAFVNSMFFAGDILKDYAALGMVLLLFYRCSARTAFLIAIALLLAEPVITHFVEAIPQPQWDMQHLRLLYHSHNLIDVFKSNLIGTYYNEMISPVYAITVHMVMLYCFLFGFSAQKVHFFSNLREHKKALWRIWWITLAFALALIVPGFINKHLGWPFDKYYAVNFPVAMATMFFTMSSICLLYIGGRLQRAFRALGIIGKMTLTNYMTQNLLILLLFSGCGLDLAGKKPVYFYLGVAIIVYVLQVFFSRWWLSRYNYGPMEWVWRMLSYRRKLVMRQT